MKISLPLKRLALTVLLLTAVLLPLTADEFFIIDHYYIDIRANENNSYDITEIIDVEFQAERHGIYRNIPRSTYDGHPVKISDINVEGFQSKTKRSGKDLVIRIGSADSYVNGLQKYEISYSYDIGDDRNPDMDELYYNLIGAQWDTIIKEAEFRIEMPFDFDKSRLNFTTGPIGSTDNSNVEWKVSGKVITGRTKSMLDYYDGLTVALSLPEGYWENPVHHIDFKKLFFTIFGLPLQALVIILTGLLWFFKGRDNKLYPSVEFDAPEGLTPAEIGYIIDGSVDSKDVTALLIYWADRGYIEIEDKTSGEGLFAKKNMLITKNKELGSEAYSYEKYMFKKLFKTYGDGSSVETKDLVNKFYSTVNETGRRVKKSFTDNKERRIYEKKTGKYTFLGGLLAALPVIIMTVQGFSGLSGTGGPPSVLGIPFSMFILIPAFLISSAIVPSAGASGSMRRSSLFFGLIFGIISHSIFLFIMVFEGRVPLEVFIGAVLSCYISAVFVHLMPKRTKRGDEILEKVLGFREFIKTAEKEKLETMFESNPEYYYNILPYALVFGLTRKWAEHFEGMTIEPPTWYHSYRKTSFSPVGFADNLQTGFNTLNSSMNSSPSSSGGGSSSGGSSGGGSGGGGGGSW